ncbi:hypothetical protein ABZ348_13395 [Streptomyces sp. NPDC005963]|uniref:nSTAND1 domain-containing NTPase n=1 Tax=Streptomyces sp. NPDC005963 TaxID=3156721 RepID=UPI0033DE6A4E
MGRREKPLEPDAGPVQRFASELRELRRAAGGPTYRAMAKSCPYSAPTLSIAAAGERLPSLAVTLAYVAACGGDAEVWEKRWHMAATDEADHTRDDGTHAPYPGLARYELADSDHFFGRDGLVADLVELIGRRPFVALVGASGSGKSSLLRAGLVPAVRASGTGPSVIRILTPSPPRIRPGLLTEDALVLVDQFEELFTVCRNREERNTFIQTLLDSPARIVIAVRADFYGRCAEHPALATALKDAVLLVGPMTSEQLREAVVGPATAEQLTVERALTARIVADAGAEPGGLPLVSHALLEIWQRRRGRTLTEAAYESIGGLHGAIAHTAEGVFATLSEPEAQAARVLLLRLIAPGEASADTRRPAQRAELELSPECTRVLERLVRARLLTIDDHAVNLAHEALITGWPRLRRWIEADRETLRLHRRLTEAARVWEELGRDVGALYWGAQLESAREAFTDSDALTPEERSFLHLSLRTHDNARRADARAARRLRFLTVCLSLLVCLATVAGVVAWWQSEVSERRAIDAEARRVAQMADTMRDTDPAAAIQLSLAAWRLADLPETRRALFAAGAQSEVSSFTPPWNSAPGFFDGQHHLSADGRTVLSLGANHIDRWDVSTGKRLPQLRLEHEKRGRVLEIAPDLRTAAVRTLHGVQLWDLGSGGPLRPLPTSPRNPSPSWFSDRGRLFALHEPGRSVKVWDTRSGVQVLDTGGIWSAVDELQFSPDDRLMALCADNRSLRIWDVRKRRPLVTPWLSSLGGCAGNTFRFAPDGRTLAITTPTGVRLWDLPSGRESARVGTSRQSDLTFSADGSHLATLGEGEILLWRLASPTVPVLRFPLQRRDVFALRLDMSRGVLRYAMGQKHGFTVRTIHVRTPTPDVEQQVPLTAAEYSPDGTVLATVSAGQYEIRHADGTRYWGKTGATPQGCGSNCARYMTFDRHTETFAQLTASGRIDVWNLKNGKRRQTPPVRAGVTALALIDLWGKVVVSRSYGYSQSLEILSLPPGRPKARWSNLLVGVPGPILATGMYDSLVTAARQRITHNGPQLPSDHFIAHGEGPLLAAAVSNDRRLMAVSDVDGRITLWDEEGMRRISVLSSGDPLNKSRAGETAPALAFSPDSSKLAVGDANGEVRVWDTAAPRSPGKRLPQSPGPVLALAFTPDTRQVRVTTPHTASLTWSLDARRTADALCARPGLSFPRAEWKTYFPDVPHRPICPG